MEVDRVRWVRPGGYLIKVRIMLVGYQCWQSDCRPVTPCSLDVVPKRCSRANFEAEGENGLGRELVTKSLVSS
jgi:hypothetical protein